MNQARFGQVEDRDGCRTMSLKIRNNEKACHAIKPAVQEASTLNFFVTMSKALMPGKYIETCDLKAGYFDG